MEWLNERSSNSVEVDEGIKKGARTYGAEVGV
jgi:hypothetical protein